MPPTTKSVVTSVEVNVKAMDVLLVVEPLAMVESPVMVVAVMVMLGETLSKVQVNVVAAILFRLPSVNAPAATSIVHGPGAGSVGVNKAS